jgi:hypothetical protein
MLRRVIPSALILGITLTACAPTPGTLSSAEASPSAPALTSTPAPASAAPATAAPAAAPCPVPEGSTPEPEIPTILDYLNAGGAPEAFAAALESEGMAPLEGPILLVADFTGDGLEDLAFAYHAPSEAEAGPGGVIVIFQCVGQAYRPAFQETTEDPSASPAMHLAHDLTGDGVSDLVAGQRLCGAHTCFEQVSVLVWDGSSFADRLQGVSDDLPYPGVDIVGPAQDGSYGLAVTGTGIASAGAGPYRQRTRTWNWDAAAQALIPGPDVLLPSDFRIHVVLDADQAALAGDYAAAHDLYYRVVTDESLQDVEFSPEPRDHLIAYAMYREVVTYVLMNDLGDAQVVYGILQNSYPAGAPGHAYAELGTAFWDLYSASEDLAASCQAARAYAEAHADEVLSPLYYGYANPTYTAAEVCPFGG